MAHGNVPQEGFVPVSLSPEVAPKHRTYADICEMKTAGSHGLGNAVASYTSHVIHLLVGIPCSRRSRH